MVTDSGHIQNGENNRMVNHGEYYDFLYVFQPETLHSAYTTQIHVQYSTYKLTEKIIVVPFEYVLMLSRNQQPATSNKQEVNELNRLE